MAETHRKDFDEEDGEDVSACEEDDDDEYRELDGDGEEDVAEAADDDDDEEPYDPSRPARSKNKRARPSPGAGDDGAPRKKKRTRTTNVPEDVRHWLVDNYIEVPDETTPKCSVYAHYCAHCKQIGGRPRARAVFGRMVHAVFKGLKSRRLGGKDKVVPHYLGLVCRSNIESGPASTKKHGGASARAAHHVPTTQREMPARRRNPPRWMRSFKRQAEEDDDADDGEWQRRGDRRSAAGKQTARSENATKRKRSVEQGRGCTATAHHESKGEKRVKREPGTASDNDTDANRSRSGTYLVQQVIKHEVEEEDDDDEGGDPEIDDDDDGQDAEEAAAREDDNPQAEEEDDEDDEGEDDGSRARDPFRQPPELSDAISRPPTGGAAKKRRSPPLANRTSSPAPLATPSNRYVPRSYSSSSISVATTNLISDIQEMFGLTSDGQTSTHASATSTITIAPLPRHAGVPPIAGLKTPSQAVPSGSAGIWFTGWMAGVVPSDLEADDSCPMEPLVDGMPHPSSFAGVAAEILAADGDIAEVACEPAYRGHYCQSAAHYHAQTHHFHHQQHRIYDHMVKSEFVPLPVRSGPPASAPLSEYSHYM